MKRSRATLAAIVVAALTVGGCGGGGAGGGAVTLDVWPGQSIQAAVDIAQPGETVVIHPGTYRPSAAGEALVVLRVAKNGVTLRGAGASPSEVVLDGNGEVLHVIFCDQGIGRNTVIENLTITGGYAYPDTVLPPGYTPVLRPELALDNDFYHDGGGLMLFVCAPTVRNCRIINNQAERCGAGVSVFYVGDSPFPNPGPLISGNEILNNLLGLVFLGTGGGVDIYFGARADIINNLLVGNRGWGGAVAVLEGSSATLDFNTIVGNYGSVSGVAMNATSTTSLTNTIFANSVEGATLYEGGTLTTFTNCAFWNNAEPWDPPPGQGHITTDPLFLPGPRGDYYLSQTAAGQSGNSPCVDAGSGAVSGSAVEGRTTRTDGAADTGTADVGYHYRP